MPEKPPHVRADLREAFAALDVMPGFDDYTHSASVSLGEDLHVPAPLEGVLPTGEF
ncbi:hypothetical protein [Actinomadura sp. 3N508]|uniref:hypothetical protein n=1 Tax=Actinomadura sp. 3N508 TaxID=3375153 RepID=UPI00378BAF77